jgi:hypothetical protein
VPELREVVVRAIDEHMDGQIAEAVEDHNRTVPISTDKLRAMGLLGDSPSPDEK